MPLGCLGAFGFHASLLVRTLFLPAVGIVPLTLLGVRRLWRWRRTATDEATGATTTLDWLVAQSVNVLFVLLFLIYPSCSAKIFSTFQCMELDDGSRILRADFTIDCDAPAHKAMQAYAAICIFVYPVGTPVLYAYLFRVYKRQLTKARRLPSAPPTTQQGPPAPTPLAAACARGAALSAAAAEPRSPRVLATPHVTHARAQQERRPRSGGAAQRLL